MPRAEEPNGNGANRSADERETPSSLSPTANSVGEGRSVLSPSHQPLKTSNLGEGKTVNLVSMLARLQLSLNRTDLSGRLILSERRSVPETAAENHYNLMVGYSGSVKSQAALDLTLCLAHQTRLATGKPVTVQVVYVVEETVPQASSTPTSLVGSRRNRERLSVLAMPTPRKTASEEMEDRATQFEQADRILWQARCMADEWRGSLKTHLRFGVVSQELIKVAELEDAHLLVLGCESGLHPLVRQVGRHMSCPVLGIPSLLEEEAVA